MICSATDVNVVWMCKVASSDKHKDLSGSLVILPSTGNSSNITIRSLGRSEHSDSISPETSFLPDISEYLDWQAARLLAGGKAWCTRTKVDF